MAKKRVVSIKKELLVKSQEATLSAVQIYNNPNIQFKSENFIILMVIAWTYLMHAYYKEKGIDYRYYEIKGKRKVYHKTKNGACKTWELEKCLDNTESPIDENTKNNLKFLIGIRHEIEHQMTNRIDGKLSAKFQACCLNYNEYIVKLFGIDYIKKSNLSVSLQFSGINHEQRDLIEEYEGLPKNIRSYIQDFEQTLTDEQYNNEKYSYRLIYMQKLINRKGNEDQVIEFIDKNSELAKNLSKEYYMIKDREKPKYKPKQIKDKMLELGYKDFTINKHTRIWQKEDAKNIKKGYGVLLEDGNWYWYQTWYDFVLQYCIKNEEKYL